MTTAIIGKQCMWSGQIDSAGYRSYKIAWKIWSDFDDGPANVMQTPGLPLPGAPWIFDDDVDLWVWCRPDMDVKRFKQQEGEKGRLWLVEQLFSNRPLDAKFQRCHDIRIEDPLLEPMKVSGGFVKKTKEATFDRHGNPVVNSAWEQLRGGMVEFSDDNDTISIEQNVINLDLPTVQSMKNRVNKYTLWGMPPRCVLLSEFKWERKFYGLCYRYYTRKFTFEIRDNTWDQLIQDEGTKVLNGHWANKPSDGVQKRWILDNIDGVPPNPLNPQHFIRFQDFNGNTAKVMLDGFGQPYNPLLETTTEGCTQCEDGMNRYLVITEADPEFEGNFQDQVIAYSSGCLWGNSSVSLEFDENNDYWVLIDLDSETEWVLDADEWSCDSSNTMVKLNPDQNPDLPEYVVVSPTTSRPGSKLIEYYQEADFTQLGIPLIL